MKILVVSDSHGRDQHLYSAIYHHKDLDILIHLGDGEHDLKIAKNELIGKKIIQVQGNCDYFSQLPVTLIENIKNHKFLITHGAAQRVKSNLSKLIVEAKKYNCHFALFGHTHIPYYEQQSGIHLFNPGSIAKGQYGVITITDTITFEHFEM
ncbi:MAG: YfcE family phosphodiesterase [Ruminococcaceae bacterium]|nr:YfcE family phosphodiesterase [Oscillospiraceae bacterium]